MAMLGLRRAVVHIALAALLLRGFIPTGWMPSTDGDAPLVMCSVMPVHDTDSGGNKNIPAKQDNGADGQCAFAGMPMMAAPPDNMIFFTPVLQDFDRNDEDVLPARDLSPGHNRPAPRAPPAAI